MAIARTNGGTGDNTSSTSWTLTFGFTATAGRLLVIGATSWPNVMTVPSGYSLAASFEGTMNTYVWYKVAAGGETTATMDVAGGGSYSGAHVMEFSGAASSSPLDRTATGGGSSGTTAQSGTTATLSQADEVAVAAYGLNLSFGSFTQASGFTSNALTRPGGSISLQTSYKVVASTSAITADGTWGFAEVDANVIATFRAAASVVLPPALSVAAGRVSDAAVIRAGRW